LHERASPSLSSSPSVRQAAPGPWGWIRAISGWQRTSMLPIPNLRPCFTTLRLRRMLFARRKRGREISTRHERVVVEPLRAIATLSKSARRLCRPESRGVSLCGVRLGDRHQVWIGKTPFTRDAGNLPSSADGGARSPSAHSFAPTRLSGFVAAASSSRPVRPIAGRPGQFGEHDSNVFRPDFRSLFGTTASSGPLKHKKPPRRAALLTTVMLHTPTGCLLPTGTGVSQWKRSGFSPRMIP